VTEYQSDQEANQKRLMDQIEQNLGLLNKSKEVLQDINHNTLDELNKLIKDEDNI
jgi:hypothetical protein